MKAIVCTKPGQLDEIEIPDPTPIPGHSILKINRVNVCGTDLHAFEGTQPYFNYPRILGHEISGELVAIDNADGFSIGDQVTIIPYLNCGSCLACRSGKPNCCATIKVCGVHIDGAMSEYYAVPSYTLVHNLGISTASLAMVEPLAIGAHGIRRANVKAGDWVVVIGAGPIGLGAMEFAKIAGAQVIAVDINLQRLDFSRNHQGVKHTIDASHTNAFEQVRDITNGEMAAIVIDATGNQKAINAGLNYVGHGGTYVLIGLQKGDLIFNHPEFHKRETTLMSSRNATRTDFDQVINAIRQRLVDPDCYISKTVPFAAVTHEFGSWLHPSENLVKVAINISA